MGTPIGKIRFAFDISTREAWLFLALSICGWGFILYSYVFSSGLGAVLPTYAGY